MKDFDDVIADLNAHNNILVVDGLNLAFRYKHANKQSFAAEFMNTVRSLGQSYKCDKIVLLGDGGSKFRKDIYPEYKANRTAMREKQTPQEALDFKTFLAEFDRAFEMCSKEFLTLRYKGVEADDIAAYITDINPRDSHIWLISTDRDWDLLISDKVSRFSNVTRKEYTVDTWPEFYDYSIEEYISIKVIRGDKGDNVPGVAGIGEKRAATLVRQYGSALDVYDALPINDAKKYMQNLNAFKDQLLLNYQLMDLKSFAEDALIGNCDDIGKKLYKFIGEINE